MSRHVVLVVMEVPAMRTPEKVFPAIKLWFVEVPRAMR